MPRAPSAGRPHRPRFPGVFLARQRRADSRTRCRDAVARESPETRRAPMPHGWHRRRPRSGASSRAASPILVSGGFALAGPGNDGVRAVHRRSVRQREDRKLLLSADPLEVGTLPGCADRERASLAEDDALVHDPRLVERFMSATATVRQERWAPTSNVAGVEG